MHFEPLVLLVSPIVLVLVLVCKVHKQTRDHLSLSSRFRFTGAHNKCWKYVLGAITKFGKELVQTLQSQVMTMEIRSVTEKRDGMKQYLTKRSSSDEDVENFVVVDWANKVLFVLEFKCTWDQRRDYRERWASTARAATRRVTWRAQCTGLITRCPSSATMIPFQQLMTAWPDRLRWYRWWAPEATV